MVSLQAAALGTRPCYDRWRMRSTIVRKPQRQASPNPRGVTACAREAPTDTHGHSRQPHGQSDPESVDAVVTEPEPGADWQGDNPVADQRNEHRHSRVLESSQYTGDCRLRVIGDLVERDEENECCRGGEHLRIVAVQLNNLMPNMSAAARAVALAPGLWETQAVQGWVLLSYHDLAQHWSVVLAASPRIKGSFILETT